MPPESTPIPPPHAEPPPTAPRLLPANPGWLPATRRYYRTLHASETARFWRDEDLPAVYVVAAFHDRVARLLATLDDPEIDRVVRLLATPDDPGIDQERAVRRLVTLERKAIRLRDRLGLGPVARPRAALERRRQAADREEN